MKYVYLVECRQFVEGPFSKFNEPYRLEVFSSKTKALRSMNNSFECNNGYNKKEDSVMVGYGVIESFDYSCVSVDNQPMRLRLILKKVELK